MFAREFAGHEYPFFTKVIDRLLTKFRYAPQISDVWSCISEVQSEMFKTNRKKKSFEPEFDRNYTSDISKAENIRRFKLLGHFMGNPQLQRKDPDWLRRKIWPNETKEETEAKYQAIIRQEKLSAATKTRY
jgi:hypothetical protein